LTRFLLRAIELRSAFGSDSSGPETAQSTIAALDEAIQNAPALREGLTEQTLDRDLVPLIGNRG